MSGKIVNRSERVKNFLRQISYLQRVRFFITETTTDGEHITQFFIFYVGNRRQRFGFCFAQVVNNHAFAQSVKTRLQSLNVTYKIFKPDGTPLRASVKCSFKEYVPQNLNAAVTEASSPDLTHIRLVKEGESLPLMCYNIYGDEKLYLEVARANGLTNFRNLQTGQQLFFPPLSKTTA